MISQRLRGLSEDGEAIDGLLPKLEKQFSTVGISIQDQNGQLRSSFDILQDLAGVWDQLSSKQKQYFGEKVAGNRQVKTLNAIMQNWDVVTDTIDKANNAQGAAIEGNEMYMESIEGKITQLKSAFQELATTTISSDIVKVFVDIGTAIVKATTSIGGMAPVLTVVLGLFTAIKGTKIIDFFTNLGKAITGLNGAGAALSGWVGIAIAVAGAIYGIVTAISKLNDTTKQLENAKENYQKQQSAVQNLNLELKNTQDRIDELDGKELTIIEQAELDKLKETNGELRAQIKLENKLLEIADRDQRNAAVRDVQKYQSQNAKSGIIKPYEYMNRVSDKDLLEIAGYDYSTMTPIQQSDALSSINFTNDMMADLNVKALVAAREEYEKAYKDYLKLGEDADEEIISQSKQNIIDLEEEIQKYENELSSYYNTLSGKVEGISESEDSPEFTAIKNRMKEIGDYLSDDANISIKDQINTIVAKYDGAANIIKEKIQELGDAFTLDSLKDAVNENGEDIDFDALINEIATKLNRTRDEVEQLFKETWSFDSTSINPTFNVSLDDITLFSTTDSYKTLTAAMTEQQKAGVLSYETVKSLLGDEGLKGVSEYLIQTADGYALNTERIYEFIEAQDEEAKLKAIEGIMERQIQLEKLNEELANLTDAEKEAGREAELLGEISGIDQEIAQLKAAAMEADNATSALERYRAATKTANQDAEHTEGQGAFKTVKERYEEGKVGTDEFKEGMNFLLGDNWKENFEGDLDKAYKEAQKIGEKYFGENDAQSAENFRKDLADKGLATYDEASGKLTLVQNDLAIIAETLGISEDAAESLFGLLNSYSPDDQFTFERPIASVEELAVAEQKLADIEAERKRLQQELKEAEKTGDTSTVEAKKEEIAELNQQYEDLGTAIEVAKEAMENGEFEAPLTIQEALDKIAELQTAINTLNANGITVPVKMGEEYNNLVNFVTGTDGNGGYEIFVNDIGDAQERLSTIEEIIEEVRKNPNVDTEVKASITGDLEKQKDAIAAYISQTTKLQEAFPDGNFSATITCDADTDSANTKIAYTNGEIVDLNNATATPTLDAEDNVTEKAKGAKKAVEEVPDHSDTAINVEGDADVKAHDIRDTILDIPSEKTVEIYVKRIDQGEEITDEEGNTLTDSTEVKSTLNSLNASIGANKNETGSYSFVDPINYIQGVIKGLKDSGLESGIPEVESQIRQRISDGTVAFAEGVEERLESYIDAALQEYNNNELSEFPYPVESIEPVEVSTNIDEDNLVDEIEDAAEEANPRSEVNAGTDGYIQEIDDATPDEKTIILHTQIDDSTQDNVEPTGLTTPVDIDTSSADASLDSMNEKIEEESIKPVGASIEKGLEQNRKLTEEIEKEATKKVNLQFGGGLNKLDRFASGTKHAKEGLSLVDDGNGAELIEHRSDGTFELGTNNGPRLTMLDKGDVVHTAEETKKILARGNMFGSAFRNGLNNIKSIVGNAFANGSKTVVGSSSLKSIQRVLKSIRNISKGKTSSNENKNTGKSIEQFKEWAEQFFDWAEIKLNRLKTITDTWLINASIAIGSIAKNKALSNAMRSVDKQIKNTEKAYKLYIDHAEKVATEGGLTSEIVQQIQNGTISIDSYSKDMQEIIKEYQTWYEKALQCSDALRELSEQQKEIAAQRIENIINQYEDRISLYQGDIETSEARRSYREALGKQLYGTNSRGRYGSYQTDIDEQTNTLKAQRTERRRVRRELNRQIQAGYIQVGDENWQKYTEKLKSLDAEIYNTRTAIIELQDTADQVKLTKLGYKLDSLADSASHMNEMMSLHNAQGVKETSESYKELIENGMAQIENLEKQNEALREQQSGLDVLSEKYRDIEKQIQQNTSKINEIKVSQEGWNDAIVDTGIDGLKKYKESLSKMNDEYQKQKNLQEAIYNVEKARSQRTVRTYIEGKGFVYQGDEEEIKNAQENLENVVKDQLLGKIDDLITALEESKNDTNVYDANGQLIGTEYNTPQLGTLTGVLSNYNARNGQIDVAALRDSFGGEFLSGINSSTNKNTSVNIGDIIVNEANDGNELAQAIVNQFPSALLQAMYAK